MHGCQQPEGNHKESEGNPMRNKGNPDTEQVRITIQTQTLKAGSKRARDRGMTLSAYIENLLDADACNRV